MSSTRDYDDNTLILAFVKKFSEEEIREILKESIARFKIANPQFEHIDMQNIDMLKDHTSGLFSIAPHEPELWHKILESQAGVKYVEYNTYYFLA